MRAAKRKTKKAWGGQQHSQSQRNNPRVATPMSKAPIIAVVIISASILLDAVWAQEPPQPQAQPPPQSHPQAQPPPQSHAQAQPPPQYQPHAEPPPQSHFQDQPPPQSHFQAQPPPQSQPHAEPPPQSQPHHAEPPPQYQPPPQSQPAPTNGTAATRKKALGSMAREFILAHNVVRAHYREPLFKWDRNLARYARRFASKRVVDCKMIHSYGPYGENIFWGGRDHWTPTDVVESWAKEHKYYRRDANQCINGQMCGHYTQIVWRDSVRLGCARVNCLNGGMYAICSYDPPGNYINESPFESRTHSNWEDDPGPDSSTPPPPSTDPPPSPSPPLTAQPVQI